MWIATCELSAIIPGLGPWALGYLNTFWLSKHATCDCYPKDFKVQRSYRRINIKIISKKKAARMIRNQQLYFLFGYVVCDKNRCSRWHLKIHGCSLSWDGPISSILFLRLRIHAPLQSLCRSLEGPWESLGNRGAAGDADRNGNPFTWTLKSFR